VSGAVGFCLGLVVAAVLAVVKRWWHHRRWMTLTQDEKRAAFVRMLGRERGDG
jgi:hypothetical protein